MYLLSKVHPLPNKVIVTTPGYSKEFAHDGYRVLTPVTIDDCILYLWPHFLSMDCRKSRSNLFSIRNCFSSVSGFCLGGCPSFRGRPLGLLACPARSKACFSLCRFKNFLTCSRSNPYTSAIARCVSPSECIRRISASTAFILVYLLFCITIPPNVVIILHEYSAFLEPGVRRVRATIPVGQSRCFGQREPVSFSVQLIMPNQAQLRWGQNGVRWNRQHIESTGILTRSIITRAQSTVREFLSALSVPSNTQYLALFSVCVSEISHR